MFQRNPCPFSDSAILDLSGKGLTFMTRQRTMGSTVWRLLGANKVTRQYSRWGRILTYLFWPMAILEGIAWFTGNQTWWGLLFTGIAAIYGVLFVVTMPIELIRIAHREDHKK